MNGVWRRLAAAIGLLLACGQPALAEDGFPVGFVTTLTGASAMRGEDALNGFRLGLKHAGDRLGGVEIALAVIDDRGSAEAARLAVERLAGDVRARIIVAAPTAWQAMVPMVKAAEAAKAFLLGVSYAPPELAGKACSPWFFALAGSDDAEHAAMALYFRNVAYGRIWLAAPDTPEGRAAAEAFKRHHGTAVVGETYSRPGTMDFSAELAPLRRVEMDGVYLLHGGGMGVNFMRQYHAAGLGRMAPLFGPGSLLEQPFIAAAGAGALEALGAAPWVEDLDNPVSLRFAGEYESLYGRPPTLQAAFGYDAAMLLDAALRAAAENLGEAEVLREALRKAEFQSVRGPFRFDVNHFPMQNWYLRQVVRTPRGRVGNEMRQVLLRDHRDPRGADCAMRWEGAPAPEKKPAPRGGANPSARR